MGIGLGCGSMGSHWNQWGVTARAGSSIFLLLASGCCSSTGRPVSIGGPSIFICLQQSVHACGVLLASFFWYHIHMCSYRASSKAVYLLLTIELVLQALPGFRGQRRRLLLHFSLVMQYHCPVLPCSSGPAHMRESECVCVTWERERETDGSD
jgi:hypothetical protein